MTTRNFRPSFIAGNEQSKEAAPYMLCHFSASLQEKGGVMINMKLFFAIVAAVLAASSLASAQEPTTGREHPRRSPDKIMGKLDTNHDGKISLEEWKTSPRGQKDASRAEDRFKKLDSNHDGFISLDELKAQPFGSGREHGGRHHQGPSASPSPSASP
jgi:hypothetical protein